jgi:hypothetical protein
LKVNEDAWTSLWRLHPSRSEMQRYIVPVDGSEAAKDSDSSISRQTGRKNSHNLS